MARTDDEPRHLINADGARFDDELETLTEMLAALANPERTLYRNENAAAIARANAARLVIVAGPGSGKSHLFRTRIEHWLEEHPANSVYVSSFVRKLVADLQAEIDTHFAAEDQARVTVTTLHGLARSLVERGHATAALQLAPDVQVIAGPWPSVVWRDALEFHPGSNDTLKQFERQMHTEELESASPWPDVRATYLRLCRFFNAVGFADMIVLARKAAEQDSSLVAHDLWIFDEFQDFNASEEHLIRTVTARAEGVMLAGDDEQALYQQLKASHPDIIISYYDDPDVANAMLPYCSRCSYHVCLAASSFIAQHREAGAIPKIYLPLTVDESAPRVRIVGTAAPTSAVEYIVKFVEERREELEQYKADMAAGKETDPYLLILTPQKSLTFLKTYNADAKLRALVAEWAEVPGGYGPDYWRVAGYCSAAWNRADNFAVRKVLHEERVSINAVHELLLQAFDRGCGLADLGAESVVAALGTCGEVASIVSDDALDVAEKSAALADLVSVADVARLAQDLAARPLPPPDADAADEGDEAIETAGSMAPIELLSLVGSKGLSAQHVMIIGCDDVNLHRISPLTFFVAMTRARQSLHLMVSMRSGGAKDAHAYLGELPPEHCECIEYTKSAPPKTHPLLAALLRRFATWSRARR
jgi:superfamily I DNA/RNA helicase